MKLMKYKRATVSIPKITPSHRSAALKRANQKAIKGEKVSLSELLKYLNPQDDFDEAQSLMETIERKQQKAIEIAKKEQAFEIAKYLLGKLPLDKITNATGLGTEEIERMQSEEGLKKKYKRASVGIPKITPSPSTIKLKTDNEKLIKHLERLEGSPLDYGDDQDE